MTTANKITIFRILLVPFFVVQVLIYAESGNEIHRWLALFSFGLATLSDALDGYIARRYNQRSTLGTYLDPMADKILLVSGVVLFSLNNEPYFARMPLWLTVTIISRDLLVSIGIGVVHYACGKVSVKPRLTGKAATVCQMIIILWTLLQWDREILFSWWLTAAVLTGVSGFYYVFDGVKQLNASPTSGPTPDQGK